MDPDPLREEVMSGIGLPEIAIVLLIVLVIFGPKRLPQLGRSLGSGMREFKDAVTGKNKDRDDEPDEIEAPAAPADPVTASTTDDSDASRAKAADAS
jgi:sec-independent protein translocase protein TatA